MLWKKDPVKAVLPTAVVVSRDQSGNVPLSVVTAVLRVDATLLPTWLGVDSGLTGYAVIRVNKVVPRLESTKPAAQQDRKQYAKWWTDAEMQAYFATLKERFKVEILVAAPAKNAIVLPAF
jgi:peptidyl-prolyl cis-trans isomerase D